MVYVKEYEKNLSICQHRIELLNFLLVTNFDYLKRRSFVIFRK